MSLVGNHCRVLLSFKARDPLGEVAPSQIAVTFVPCPGALLISRVARIDFARSRMMDRPRCPSPICLGSNPTPSSLISIETLPLHRLSSPVLLFLSGESVVRAV